MKRVIIETITGLDNTCADGLSVDMSLAEAISTLKRKLVDAIVGSVAAVYGDAAWALALLSQLESCGIVVSDTRQLSPESEGAVILVAAPYFL